MKIFLSSPLSLSFHRPLFLLKAPPPRLYLIYYLQCSLNRSNGHQGGYWPSWQTLIILNGILLVDVTQRSLTYKSRSVHHHPFYILLRLHYNY